MKTAHLLYRSEGGNSGIAIAEPQNDDVATGPISVCGECVEPDQLFRRHTDVPGGWKLCRVCFGGG